MPRVRAGASRKNEKSKIAKLEISKIAKSQNRKSIESKRNGQLGSNLTSPQAGTSSLGSGKERPTIKDFRRLLCLWLHVLRFCTYFSFYGSQRAEGFPLHFAG